MNKRIQKLVEISNNFKSFKVLKNFNYKPKTFVELKKILIKKSNEKNNNLNDIDVSYLDKIGGFNGLNFFENNNFYVDEWDVSNATDFEDCFSYCKKFNSDLSNWDVSNAEDVSGFFYGCESFNQEVNHFNISNSKNVINFFDNCKKFNKPLYNFKFNPKLKLLNEFFYNCINFNQDISMWNVSNVEAFYGMFCYCISFKQDLSRWDVSSAKAWDDIFKGSLMEKYPELMPSKFRSDYIK